MSKKFTLIELMIVVGIIGMIAAIVIPNIIISTNRNIYKKVVTGEKVTKEEEKLLREYLKGSEEAKKDFIKEFGHWEGVTDLEIYKKPEDDAIKASEKSNQETLKKKVRLLEKKVVDLQLSNKENIGTQPYIYEVRNKRDGYKWKYAIMRNGKEIFTGGDKSECERILEIVREGFENGIEIGKREGRE